MVLIGLERKIKREREREREESKTEKKRTKRERERERESEKQQREKKTRPAQSVREKLHKHTHRVFFRPSKEEFRRSRPDAYFQSPIIFGM